jgi:hypothetical protein
MTVCHASLVALAPAPPLEIAPSPASPYLFVVVVDVQWRTLAKLKLDVRDDLALVSESFRAGLQIRSRHGPFVLASAARQPGAFLAGVHQHEKTRRHQYEVQPGLCRWRAICDFCTRKAYP